MSTAVTIRVLSVDDIASSIRNHRHWHVSALHQVLCCPAQGHIGGTSVRQLVAWLHSPEGQQVALDACYAPALLEPTVIASE